MIQQILSFFGCGAKKAEPPEPVEWSRQSWAIVMRNMVDSPACRFHIEGEFSPDPTGQVWDACSMEYKSLICDLCEEERQNQ